MAISCRFPRVWRCRTSLCSANPADKPACSSELTYNGKRRRVAGDSLPKRESAASASLVATTVETQNPKQLTPATANMRLSGRLASASSSAHMASSGAPSPPVSSPDGYGSSDPNASASASACTASLSVRERPREPPSAARNPPLTPTYRPLQPGRVLPAK